MHSLHTSRTQTRAVLLHFTPFYLIVYFLFHSQGAIASKAYNDALLRHTLNHAMADQIDHPDDCK